MSWHGYPGSDADTPPSPTAPPRLPPNQATRATTRRTRRSGAAPAPTGLPGTANPMRRLQCLCAALAPQHSESVIKCVGHSPGPDTTRARARAPQGHGPGPGRERDARAAVGALPRRRGVGHTRARAHRGQDVGALGVLGHVLGGAVPVAAAHGHPRGRAAYVPAPHPHPRSLAYFAFSFFCPRSPSPLPPPHTPLHARYHATTPPNAHLLVFGCGAPTRASPTFI